jgi:hypothetical protein
VLATAAYHTATRNLPFRPSSSFIPHLATKITCQYRDIQERASFLWWGAVTPLPNPKAVGSPIVSCLLLFNIFAATINIWEFLTWSSRLFSVKVLFLPPPRPAPFHFVIGNIILCVHWSMLSGSKGFSDKGSFSFIPECNLDWFHCVLFVRLQMSEITRHHSHPTVLHHVKYNNRSAPRRVLRM